MAELLSIPDGVRRHIFQLAGGEERNISQTCRSGHAYAGPLLRAAKLAIDHVLEMEDSDGDDSGDDSPAQLEHALDRLQLHANMERVRTVLCGFGRTQFADCYWLRDIAASTPRFNTLNDDAIDSGSNRV